MTNEVGENFILYEMAQEIWTTAKETYSKTEDVSDGNVKLMLESIRRLLRRNEFTSFY